MPKPTTIRVPRDVLRWILARASAELYEGAELELQEMIQPPDRDDASDVERYVQEGEVLEATIERIGWLDRGPIESVRTYVITAIGDAELGAMRAFDEGVAQAGEILALELEDRPAELAKEVVVLQSEIWNAGAAGGSRAGMALQGIHKKEIERRRNAVVAIVRRLAARLGRRPDATERLRLLELSHALWGPAIEDLVRPGARHPSLPDAEIEKARVRLTTAVTAALDELSEAVIRTMIAGDQIQIHATSSQVNAGGRGNTVEMHQHLGADVRAQFDALEEALRGLGDQASGLLSDVKQLKALAATADAPRRILALSLDGIREAAGKLSVAEGALAFGTRAVAAAEALRAAFGG